MPPVTYTGVLEALYKIGPLIETSEGYRPLYASDIESWSNVTGYRYSFWVNEALIRCSMAHFKELKSENKQPPWRDMEVDKAEATKQIKAAFRLKG